MSHVQAITRKRFRRLYYITVGLIFLTTIGSLVVPAYLEFRSELNRKIDQVVAGIMVQKRALLEVIVVEKIGDIIHIRDEVASRAPALSPAEIDEQFRAEVREMIHSTRLPDDGYVWINEIVDYNGGDNYAFRFVHPNLPDTEGDFLSTSTTDLHGNLPYKIELEGIKEEGEIFFDYYFKEMGSDQISRKLSFAKLYEPYDWVVASGVYLNDVDRLVQTETRRMTASTNRALRNVIVAVLLGATVLVIMTVVFETRVRSAIDSHLEIEQSIGNQLREEKSKLEQMNSQKDQLLSIIAHDLRNPIQAFSSGITMLDETAGDQFDDLGKTILNELKISAAGVSSLLDHLLEWSYAQQQRVLFQPRMVDLRAVVAEAATQLAPVSRQKGVEIQNLVTAGAMAFADEQILTVVLRNLVGNAIKFTPRGGKITVQSKSLPGAVEVSVTDNGVGISERSRKTLFTVNSSHQTLGTDGEKGTGLGLNLCSELVHRHNGEIRVESTPGEGSTFTFTLPSPDGSQRNA